VRQMNVVQVTSYSARYILMLTLYVDCSLFSRTSAANILCRKMGMFLNHASDRDLLY